MTWRLVKMNSGWYATDIIDVASDSDNIESFVEEDNVVVIGDDLETIADALDITREEITT